MVFTVIWTTVSNDYLTYVRIQLDYFPVYTVDNERMDVNSAKEAGITIVNEVGVDPGIDHMLAMQCFDDVKIRSGKVVHSHTRSIAYSCYNNEINASNRLE